MSAPVLPLLVLLAVQLWGLCPATAAGAEAAGAGAGAGEENTSHRETPRGLLKVDVGNFEETVEKHELSVMVFFTKFSPYHRYAQEVLSNASLVYHQRDYAPSVAFCSVDLDDSPELSTFTHFNSIDIMYFYPHLILNGVRYPGNLTVEALMNHTDMMYHHSTAHLQSLAQPFTGQKLGKLVKHFVDFNANYSSSVRSLEMQLQYQADMLQTLLAINNDTGLLAKESNQHVQTVLRFDGKYSSASEFLHARRWNELYNHFLWHLYEREIPQAAPQQLSSLHIAAAKKKREQRIEIEVEAGEELF